MEQPTKPVAIFHWLPYEVGSEKLDIWQHDPVDDEMLDKMVKYCQEFKMGGILRPRRFWIERLSSE